MIDERGIDENHEPMKKPSTHDAYIKAAPDFAVPILTKIRTVMHKACPDLLETMKWGAPHFEHEGIVAGMAAFKRHVRFAFWRGKELKDTDALLDIVGDTDIGAMHYEQLDDLPSERVLSRYVKEAVRLNEASARAPRKPAENATKRQVAAPADLKTALKKSKKAHTTFEGFGFSARKEYVEWITEAKREATRAKRIETAVEWLAEGKPRNWKYMKEWR